MNEVWIIAPPYTDVDSIYHSVCVIHSPTCG